MWEENHYELRHTKTDLHISLSLSYTVPTKWSSAHRLLCPKVGLMIHGLLQHTYFSYLTQSVFVVSSEFYESVVSVIPKEGLFSLVGRQQ